MLDVNPDNEITKNNSIKVSSVVKWATFLVYKMVTRLIKGTVNKFLE